MDRLTRLSTLALLVAAVAVALANSRTHSTEPAPVGSADSSLKTASGVSVSVNWSSMTELEAETLAYNCWMSARAACNTNAADLRAFSADSYYSFCELSGISPKPTTEQVRAGTVAYCGWLSVISGKEDHAAMKAHGPDSYRSFIVKAMSH